MQPITSRFRKDQLQQIRDQLQQRTLLRNYSILYRPRRLDFISIGRVLSINTDELFPPAGKAQIRERGKSENIANEETSYEKFFL